MRYRLAVGAYPDKLSPSPSSGTKEGDNDVAPRVTELRPPGGDTAMSRQEPPEDSSREPTAREAEGLHFPDSLPNAQKTEVARLLRHLEPSQAQILMDELDGALQVPGTIRTPTRQPAHYLGPQVLLRQRRLASLRQRTRARQA